jgi:predicted alpha/beta-fold hydrolase
MIEKSDFTPAWWLRGTHAQTLWPYLFGNRAVPALTPERLSLPDGDFVDLCWTPEDDVDAAAPVVAVFHGLEGSIRSPYAARIMAAVHKQSWCGVFMHFRGCSGEPNRGRGSYHSGHTVDIAYLLDALRLRFPRSRLFAVGYSLGGNALLKYLGEQGPAAPLHAAAAVSVPFSLADGALRLNRGLSRIYQHHLIRLLQHKVLRKVGLGRLDYAPNEVARLKTFYHFDDVVTAPLHGFAGADDYYAQCSSRQYLRDICIPTLILHARDDPFMTPASIPGEGELSDQVRLELSDRGGHVGFISGGLPWRPDYWLERRLLSYFMLFARG